MEEKELRSNDKKSASIQIVIRVQIFQRTLFIAFSLNSPLTKFLCITVSIDYLRLFSSWCIEVHYLLEISSLYESLGIFIGVLIYIYITSN